SAQQQLADLARPPMRFLALERHDHRLELRRQLIGKTHRPARAVTKRMQSVFLVALVDLVAGLVGDPKLPTELAHPLAIQNAQQETKTFLHHRTLSPRHRHLPGRGESVTHVSGTKRHLSVGTLTSAWIFNRSTSRGGSAAAHAAAAAIARFA